MHSRKLSYRQTIYPATIAQVIPLVIEKIHEKSRDNGGKPVTIKMTDIFGGDGVFLEMFDAQLQKELALKGIAMPQMEYYLVDGSPILAGIASKRFAHMSNVRVIKGDLLRGRFPSQISNSDIITSIGGGFNRQVASIEEAETLIKSIGSVLADDGRLVITGITRVVLNASQFEQFGWNVLNKSIPKFLKLIVKDYPVQMYVLAKSNRPFTATSTDEGIVNGTESLEITQKDFHESRNNVAIDFIATSLFAEMTRIRLIQGDHIVMNLGSGAIHLMDYGWLHHSTI